MQAAKDSFYMALRSRLAELNPQRTATLGGVTRPAIMVVENERAGEDADANETFCFEWGAPGPAEAGGALQSMTCKVRYQTRGSESAAGTDRGRVLGIMDTELECICIPSCTEKMDYTQTPAVALGSEVFWGTPVFADAEFQSVAIGRIATVKIYFTPEGA